ncbi:Nedd4 interacting protein [Mortierella polycephala]|uniref:Nedd4 interacting protein n=1 Tax=Mortierella polycephala TaxID=41804 RepID=A0A9P6PLM2_9FUNG|nr:Nedd4 interacting protein [Mortierella polycephala]
MSRSHSYAQIPVSEAHEDDENNNTTHTPSIHSRMPTLPRLPSASSPSTAHPNEYTRVQNEDFDEIDEDEADVMLRPLPKRTSDTEITIGPSIHQQETSTTSGPSGQAQQQQQTQQPTRPQFPAAAGARRMIQQTMDGVFSNLSAKPRVEKPFQEELPPPYKAAALDQSPVYYETTVVAPGCSENDVLVDGLPVGGFVGFMWNMIISMSFQFVGFFLTYLLHTSHATKNGSKMGLGITFISMGTQVLSGKTDMDEQPDVIDDTDTGYMGDVEQGLGSIKEYMWISYFMMFVGSAIILQSGYDFLRAKRTERVINATSPTSASQDAEAEAVNDSVV